MIEYLPWSKKVLSEVILSQKKGNIPVLDIEFTAKCTGASCIYCDSKPDVCNNGQPGEFEYETIKKVILDAKEQGLKWVYTCGLGEPLEDDKFWKIIALLKENDIGLSMFSNGVFISNVHIAKELLNHNVNIILKMDTFDERKFDEILGRQGIAQKIYAARDYLLEAGYGNNNGYTNLAFSIVPTSLSIGGIPKVIEFAKQNGIFASIGELEQAGAVLQNELVDSLSIPEHSCKELKKLADSYARGSYMRPICPCILTGLHIDNLGNCVVDEDTGLNCKWFLLKDPRTIKLGNIYNDSVVSLFNKVNTYREQCFKNKIELIKNTCEVSYVFGGCGGNPKDIVELALKQYE